MHTYRETLGTRQKEQTINLRVQSGREREGEHTYQRENTGKASKKGSRS